MFWGLILEPSKSYSQIVERPFHISQAALDFSTGDNDACQVMVSIDRKKFLICTLQKSRTVQAPLDLYFKSGESITFVTNGKCNIHLTGYLDPEFEEEEEDDEEEVADVPIGRKRKSPAVDVGNKSKKFKKVEDTSESESDNNEQLTKFLDGQDIDTDENDGEFSVNTSAEADQSDSDEEDENDDDEEEDDEEDDDEEDEDGDDEENEDEAQANGFDSTLNSTLDSSLDNAKNAADIDVSKLTKSQRRRLKKKLSKQTEVKPQVNGVTKSQETNRKTMESKGLKKEEKKAQKVIEKKEEQKEKKSLTGGVQIEDIVLGSGPPAKAGKVVMVYYEGRLKTNNKTFDKCNKGPGFKFKLGAKEVISGWDIGVAGMKVGGLRKIVCPPAMAYGAKGSPPVIPPNSTLVFEVELKNVK